MKSHFLIALSLISGVWLAAMPVRAQEVTQENVDGVKNFHRLETTVACAGAVKADAIPEIKKFGFASIINLREASEDGANLEAEAAAARAADLHYYSIPFNSAAPDPAVADKFLDAITAKGSDPAFIHCAGGGRAATMWFIKRLVIDHWDVDRAAKEATDLGMTSPKLKQFAIDYAQTHKR
ncbi:MAG TPA: sulfur transferase domain-containing protein [Candidatus Acidoferrales bacterium]|nr:sulfur transferase domain-containing protein [Candidatus Acidoferrales bacterium]